MTTIFLTDLNDLRELFGGPRKEQILRSAADDIDQLFLKEKIKSDESAMTIIINLVESVMNDMSMTMDSTLAQSSREHQINNTWDLSCQCRRVRNYCEYRLVLWKLVDDSPIKAFPVAKWKEYLPETH